MAKLTAKEAGRLANDFLGLAQAIGDYRYSHWDQLSAKENKELSNRQWSVLNAGEDILALSTTLVLEEVADTLSQLDHLTEAIRQDIDKQVRAQKVIQIAGIIVALGGAVISKRPQAVLDHLKALSDAWNT